MARVTEDTAHEMFEGHFVGAQGFEVSVTVSVPRAVLTAAVPRAAGSAPHWFDEHGVRNALVTAADAAVQRAGVIAVNAALAEWDHAHPRRADDTGAPRAMYPDAGAQSGEYGAPNPKYRGNIVGGVRYVGEN
jgi:hypothetical protein